MPILFGTDGVRGVANRDLTPDLALALGRAGGLVLAPNGGEVFVGRDTRLSGPMLEGALVAGLCSAGVHVRTLGVVPSPAVAFVTISEKARAGAMVSASHNPVPDNGIKFFSGEGLKIPIDVEEEIEGLLEHPGTDLPFGLDVGRAEDAPEAIEKYFAHLLSTVEGSLAGLKIVLDCAYGSANLLGPRAFREAGAEVIAFNDEPDGARINVNCGSTSLDGLSERVIAEQGHLGLGFDGDADRVLACDEEGAPVDGDRIIGLIALRMHDAGTLDHDVVVVTVMANLGFRRALEERGIEVVQTPVGDRHVVEAMRERGGVLGGEQSGHIVFSRHATTGDGILTGLQVASAVASLGEPLSHLANVFEPVPQVLLNVRVSGLSHLEDAEELWEEVRAAEASMGEDGRVLLRPSGTEAVVRVMVEHVDESTAHAYAERLAKAVEESLS
jgi:phosphoglucosamine mutase